MIYDVIYSLLVLIWKIRVFQQTVVRFYYILKVITGIFTGYCAIVLGDEVEK